MDAFMDTTMDGPQHFTIIDYLVFGLLLLLSTLIGVWFGFFAKQKQDSTAEYLMGGKTMGIFPISMSLIASSISGISLLAVPADMYVYGTQYFMIVISDMISGFIIATVYIPVFHKLQVTSSYEYLQLRFNHNVRLMGSLIFITKMVLYIPVVIYVPALAFNQVTGVNIHLITPIVCLICIFYTSLGGLKAVVWTDTLQTVLMYGAALIVMVLGTIKVGGISEVWDRNRRSDRLEFFNFDPNPTVRLTFWSTVVGEIFHQVSHCAVNQAMVQRCLAMSNMRRVKITIGLFSFGLVIIYVMICYIGIVIYALFHDCDPMSSKAISKVDQLLPFFVMKISGSVPGLVGMFVAGVFSAALSSMSTGLNSLTGVISEDLIRPMLKRPITEKRASTIMKVIAVVTGILCTVLVVVVEKMGALLRVAFSLSSITNSALLGVFTLGLFFPWANSKGALSGTIASLVIVSWLSAGSQSATMRGLLTHPQKPVSMAGCPVEFMNTTVPNFIEISPDEEPLLALYSISFMYYTLIGAVTGVVVGLVVSFLTGAQDPRDLSLDVLASVIHRFVPRHDRIAQAQYEMKQFTKEVTM